MQTESSMPHSRALSGERVFGVVWFGQLISFIGSGLTSFALGVWVYQTTGSITLFALIALFYTLGGVVFGPVAGALADRWDRRRAMILSDAGAGLSTLVVVLLLAMGRLEVWPIYIVVFTRSICDALRWPALSAATTQLVSKEQFSRANGLLQIVQVGQVLVSPIIAGALLGFIGLEGVVLIDVITFFFALVTLLLVRIPRPPATAEGQAGKGSLLRESIYGWTYIRSRDGLLALVVSISITNFLFELIAILYTPLILAFNSAAVLGTVLALGGIGYLAGSILMSTWKGTRQQVKLMIGSMLLLGFCVMLIGLRPSVPLITFGIFGGLFFLPIVSVCNQVIWQTKTAPDVQGRVFAIRTTIQWAIPLLADAIAGPLADRIFEPLFASNGLLAGNVGQVIGAGEGRGVAFLIITIGLLIMVTALASYSYPRLRLLEQEIPDAVVEQGSSVEPGSVPTAVPAN